MITFDQLNSIHIELSSACNASCPNCPRNVHGGYVVPGLTPKTISLDQFKLIFSGSVLKQIDRILMCGNYGDPIYCVDLPEILKYVSSVDSSVSIKIHTNGGIRSQKWWSQLALAYDPNRMQVVFSIDGLESTNHIYRRGVKWKTVLSNLKAFVNSGGNAIWEFLIFRHNEHQIEDAKKLARDLGVEIVFKRPFGVDQTNMKVVDKLGKYEYEIEPAECFSIDTRKSSHSSITREEYIDRFKKMTKSRHDVIGKEQYNMTQLDDVEISCMTKDTGEIYISSDGVVHPCCFLGVNQGPLLHSIDYLQYTQWLEDNVRLEEVNALNYTIEEILELDYMLKIESTWSQSHKDGRMMCCTKMCAKKTGTKNGLYTEI